MVRCGSRNPGVRAELVFDRHSLQLIAERTVVDEKDGRP